MPEQDQIKVHVPRNVSDITLPPEDADKPADIDLDPNHGDEEVVADDAAKEAEAKAAKEKEEADKKAAEDANKTDEEKKAEADAAAAEAEKKKKEDEQKLTPFHEHPDWIKMQEQLKSKELELAEVKGKIDVLVTQQKTTKAEAAATAKTVEQRIQEDLDKGWEPKSQVEISLRTSRYVQEEMEAKQDAKDKEENDKNDARNTSVNEFQAAVNVAYDDLKLPEGDEQKVVERIKQLKQDGLLVLNSQTIGRAIHFAHDQLKAEGAFMDTTKKDLEKKKEEERKKAEEEKTKANAKISRSGGDGAGKTTAEKKPVSQLRRSLDDIVEEHSKTIG